MSSLTELQDAVATHGPVVPAQKAFARANSNAGRNVYLAMDQERTLAEAEARLEGQLWA